jgi:hypothetical protein
MKELLTQYPKAAKVVKDYYLEKFMKGLEGKDFPPEYLEHVRQQGLQDEILDGILDVNPRALFDLFDEKGLIICINGFSDSEEVLFIWSIFSNHSHTSDKYKYKSRIEAEKEAIKESFSILESKLV